ncbi:glycosyltransferase family 4 protein [Salinibacter ruber]|uniref:glycosyltransferase family 4 protein n=1 Tax=Salinibacter ruber TaxID=146919 RepID=UPI001F07C036|nr:glycosyltransferase family 4 protein [Salinibacter ruber]
MRLLFVSHSLPPEGRPLANVGGMQRVALKLHETLEARADANALDYDALLLRSTWRTVHLKTPLFLARAGWQIARAARQNAVDVVLFSSMVTASLAVPLQGLLRRHGVRTAAIVHGLDVTTPFPPYQWFVPKVFGALDAVLPVSRATRQACLDRGAAPTRLRVVPNGIDTDRFEAPADRATARRALAASVEASPPSPPPDGLLLCSVGRQVERKGTAWFVDAVMPRLPADVHYWVAGDGPELDTIEAAIARHDLAPRVRLLGRIPNDTLGALYRGADLFVMPNVPVEDDMEGFGIVLLEAGQCGTPAVAARLEGIQDVIADGVNGHLVAPQSPDAFVDAIAAYRNDSEALDAAAQRALHYTEDTFGWPAVADTYLLVLRTLWRQGTPPAPDTTGRPPAHSRAAG